MTRKALHRYARMFRYFNAALLLLTVAGLGFLAGTYVEVRKDLPDPENFDAYRPRLTTQIFSTEVYPDKTEHHTLLARVFEEDREPENLRDVPVELQKATIAIEDYRFSTHRGIDPQGILRAMVVNLRRGRLSQGGSTITQQLARNMWLTREKTIPRKLKEMLLAAELEQRFSKDEILEMYLNQVYYGHRAYGVKRAASIFFNKATKNLTLGECALLAGLPQSPLAYSPYDYPKRAKARRHQVLLAMLHQGYIDQAKFEAADKEQIQGALVPLKDQKFTSYLAPYFTHRVIRELCAKYPGVYGSGLQVYTTLDMRVQKAAEEELTRGVKNLRAEGAIKSGLVGQGALCCVDPRTGYVLAMVGGVGPYNKTQFNRADPAGVNASGGANALFRKGVPYGRQPGSSFKPYIWATALEYGYGPDSSFSGDPLSIPIGNGKYYTPKNYTPRQGGSYTLRNALAQSVNLVSVRIVRKLGIDAVRTKTAEMLNIPEDRIQPYYSLALGANELSPLEQATGYCAFATAGMRPTATFIRRITTWDGTETFAAMPQLVRVMRPDTGVSMISMLRNVVTSGTGRRAYIPGYPACGKTGTTNSGRDVWWVGFTPDLSTAVWVGNDDNSPMPQGSGGGFCAPIWARFMRRALEELKLDGEFPSGAGVSGSKHGDDDSDREERRTEETSERTVTVCTASGQLATPYCPSTAERVLSAGAHSPGRCRMHGASGRRDRVRDDDERRAPAGPAADTGGQTYTVCAKTGLRAGPNCAQTTESNRAPSGTCRSCGRETHPEPRPRPEPRPEPRPDGAKNDEG